MLLELVDSLRCVRSHEDSWLVARADELLDRHIVQGVLGCPVCETRYAVKDGVADFTMGASRSMSESTDPEANAELAMRAAALLGLTDPKGLVVLAGAWSACADALLDMVDGIQLLAFEPARELRSGGALSLARMAQVLPPAASSA